MKRLLLTYLFLLFSSFIYSQVGINTNSPDPSSALDIQSTNGGILIPRLTQDQRDAIAYPATGLLIFKLMNLLDFISIMVSNGLELKEQDLNKTLKLQLKE